MTQIFVKYILHLCIFRHLKLEIALAIPASNDKNRTPTPVYLDPGMHSGLEVKGLIIIILTHIMMVKIPRKIGRVDTMFSQTVDQHCPSILSAWI